jgi:hypothetical protein
MTTVVTITNTKPILCFTNEAHSQTNYRSIFNLSGMYLYLMVKHYKLQSIRIA